MAALSLGCDSFVPSPDDDAAGDRSGRAAEAARAEPLVAALASRLDAEADGGAARATPAAPRWPADLGFHPGARAESVEFDAVLEDDAGGRHSLVRRLDRLAVRGPSDPVTAESGGFAFRDVLRASAAITSVDADAGPASTVRRERLERATLGLAESDERSLRVRDVTLVASGDDVTSTAPDSTGSGDRASGEVPGSAAADGRCRVRYTLSDGDGASLAFSQDACPATTVAGPLVLATSPTLVVDGTLVLDGEPRAVTGRGWMRRVWGEPPLPGGAVVFDRLVLELDELGLVDVVRSKRRSGRGPKSATARLRRASGDGAGADVDVGGVEWLDGGNGAGVPDGDDGEDGVPAAWTLRVPEAGIDVSLTPVVDVPLGDDAFGPAWRGGVAASGSHVGLGFVEFLPVGDASEGDVAETE